MGPITRELKDDCPIGAACRACRLDALRALARKHAAWIDNRSEASWIVSALHIVRDDRSLTRLQVDAAYVASEVWRRRWERK